ncbi:hypothetical protein MACH09_27310 [Vibrio sp. MACH09]|uniref:fimbrial protein n=1 Tax=Vibrio sp. MACH09 TaxID=3025122 RepID=UPI00279491F5|nr:fimbrial protein [Vibrio sp. MACH09]GLO62223.1 hypothetical protein MACH09_27310 [Vibrio sp. MACH09]
MKNHLTYLMIIASLLLLPKEALARCGYRISEANIFSITLPGLINGYGINHAIDPVGLSPYRAPARGRGATSGAYYPTNVNVQVNANESLQRVGSVIGSVTMDYRKGKGYDTSWGGSVVSYGYNNYDLLFECRTSTKSANEIVPLTIFHPWVAPRLMEYYAINRGWNSKKYLEEITNLDNSGGLLGVYYTRFKNVGVRILNTKTDRPFKARWQRRSLPKSSWVCASALGTLLPIYNKTSCDDSSMNWNSRAFIPASAFSGVTIQFIRVKNSPKWAVDGNTVGFVDVVKGQPLAYTLFQNESHSNPGYPDNRGLYAGYPNKILNTLADFSDLSGKGFILTNNSHYLNYPMVWRPTVNITRINSCRITDYTKTVDFGSIGAVELRDGAVREKDFSISVACADNVGGSGTMNTQVAMGLLVKGDTAIRKAQQLGLKTSEGGLTYLLDNEYGRSGVAQGVGIQVKKIGSSNYLNLLADNSIGGGNNKGWYGYRDLLPSPNGTTSDGIKMYSGKFSAELKRIASQSVIAGSVNAQLEIILALQ